MARNVSDYIQSKVIECGDNVDLAESWVQLDDLYTKKLWHQLTEAVKVFVRQSIFIHGGLVEFYHMFISDFEHKINPLSLVEIVLVVVTEIINHEEAFAFIEGMKEKVKNDLEAKVLCMIEIGRIKLRAQLMDDVKTIIEESSELLDTVDGITSVHSRYYELSSEYYKVKSDHTSYYRDALRYLGCVDIHAMSVEEKSSRGFCLAIAALVGEGIFNFGELLCQGVMEGLKQTEKGWLVDLLQAFNEGNLARFYSLKQFWELQPDLLSNQHKLEAKIRLLCLMELIFRRHAHKRTIPFVTIAEAAQVDIKEVELLVMKALSLGLVKGTIDEVDQQVNMTWVQPRVLDYTQVHSLRDRVAEWSTQIRDTIKLIEDTAPEVVAHS